MKEKKTLAQHLLARLKKSASKVDKRAKKPFRAIAKAQGVPKKRIKAALKPPKAPARATRTGPSPKPRQMAAARMDSPELREKKSLDIKGLIALGKRLNGVYGQLRTTGGRRLKRK